MKSAQKYIFLLILLIASWNVKAQFNYEISGTFESVGNGTKLYIHDSPYNKPLDSFVYNNGFVYKGRQKELSEVTIRNKQLTSYAYFIIEPGKLRIMGGKTASEFSMIGNRENQVLTKIQSFRTQEDDRIIRRLINLRDSVNRLIHVKDSVDKIELSKWTMYNDSVNSRIAIIDARRDTFYMHHPNNFANLNTLWNLRFQYNFDTLKNRFKQITASYLRSHTFSRRLEEFIESFSMEKAVAINQADTSGKIHSIKFPNENYVLLDFWASWCVPCRKNTPILKRLSETYDNLTIVGVSIDNLDDKKYWIDAIKEDGMTWLNLSDLKGFDNQVALKYGVRDIPVYILIAPDGKIISKTINKIDKVEGHLKQIFGK